MQGTSPFAYQSPSFHSSSYLPKLEANFMKDFSCCDLTLGTLHDLLQHFEETHAQQVPVDIPLPPPPGSTALSEAREAASASAAIQVKQEAEQPFKNIITDSPLPAAGTEALSHAGFPRKSQQHLPFNSGECSRPQVPPVQDIDPIEDIEMEMEIDEIRDAGYGVGFNSSIPGQAQYPPRNISQLPPRSRFGQPAARLPPLEIKTLNGSNPLQLHQGLRQSQPSTPVSGGRPGTVYQNNPTVSSVNTPTLTAHPLQQHQFRNTPDSSAPGTPGELDPEFIGTVGSMSMDPNQHLVQHHPQDVVDGYDFGTGSDIMGDLCIDEPAKRLFNGGSSHQHNVDSRLGTAQYGPNSEIAKRIREQQRKVGLADTVSGPNGEVGKPFRCPVIGCEKAYKNQNGLKYHKSVSNSP